MMLTTLEKGETRHINPSHVVFAYESDGHYDGATMPEYAHEGRSNE